MRLQSKNTSEDLGQTINLSLRAQAKQKLPSNNTKTIPSQCVQSRRPNESSSSSSSDIVPEMIPAASCQGCKKHEDRVYVQAGALGNGTRDSPYGSLAAAQADTSWRTLVIYYSASPLDGGISLRAGTTVIGISDDSGSTVIPAKPTISNTDPDSNGGNGIYVLSGSVCIENIAIQNTYSSAINYDNATDVRVSDVTISGHNQGSVIVAIGGMFGFPNTSYVEVGGIHGQNNNNGSLNLCKVTISNNYTGPGIYDAPYDGAKRNLYAYTCEFYDLSCNAPNVINLYYANSGVIMESFNRGTEHYGQFINCYFHDFALNSVPVVAQGLKLSVLNGAYNRTLVKNCSFENIYGNFVGNNSVNNVSRSYGIRAEIQTYPGTSSLESRGDILIEGCEFNETASGLAGITNGLGDGFTIFGISLQNYNARSRVEISDNVFTNTFFNIFTIDEGSANSKFKIVENVGSGVGVFYAATTAAESGPSSGITTEADLFDNNFTGGAYGGAIVIIPNVDGRDSGWKSLLLNVADNCFDGRDLGGGRGLLGIATVNSSSYAAGDIIVKAHYNNFTDYQTSILDVFANVDYLISKNWWGQSSNPGTIELVGTYTATLDTSNLLHNPIVCNSEESNDSNSSSSHSNDSRHHTRNSNIVTKIEGNRSNQGAILNPAVKQFTDLALMSLRQTRLSSKIFTEVVNQRTRQPRPQKLAVLPINPPKKNNFSPKNI